MIVIQTATKSNEDIEVDLITTNYTAMIRYGQICTNVKSRGAAIPSPSADHSVVNVE